MRVPQADGTLVALPVTQIVWPRGWVCQAVRAPGAKWTCAAPTGHASPATAIVSTKTVPVNHSAGPAPVSRVFLVISIPGVWR